MASFFLFATIFLAVTILMPFYRVVQGPTLFDRLLAVSAMGSKTIGLVCLLGLMFGRLDMFIDIALAFAILNFIGSIALANYFRPPQS